ncbi:MAG: chemotaxis protein CheW [Methylococcales bacterium]|nr:chemotaxis protein CheW [Methylococcales bacterium]
MTKKTSTQIVHQEVALDTYLSTLLEAIPEAHEIPPAPVPEEALRAGQIESELPRPVETAKPLLEPEPVKPMALMPTWTQASFQVLLFRLNQVTMAAPLLQLATTAQFQDITTKLPKQPAWLLGLQRVQQRHLAIIDSQFIFMGTSGAGRDPAQSHYTHILISEQQRWALACDELLSVVTLAPEQVRWRTQRQRRPWLMGSVIDDLTMLIDMTQIFL